MQALFGERRTTPTLHSVSPSASQSGTSILPFKKPAAGVAEYACCRRGRMCDKGRTDRTSHAKDRTVILAPAWA
eukprot:9471450-Pyramimonas_sp.AAC.1